ncbi:MAG: universal stress protein [Promethearchaeia archaeon]
MYKKILLGIDDSADSQRAIDRVIDLKKAHNSEVVIFHSVETSVILPMNVPLINTGTGTLISATEIKAEKVQRGTMLLENAKKRFEKHSLPVKVGLIRDQKPEDYIYKAVKEEGFDLVVLGCEGNHSKIRRILKDTIPDKVLNRAPADLLIVR